jgi:hypothetical protein
MECDVYWITAAPEAKIEKALGILCDAIRRHISSKRVSRIMLQLAFLDKRNYNFP